MKDYVISTFFDPMKLVVEVQNLLIRGFECQGGVAVHIENGIPVYTQALTCEIIPPEGDMNDLSNKAKNILKGAGITTIQEIRDYGELNLFRIRGCGRYTIAEIWALTREKAIIR